jgi:hypothetical protein
MRATMTDIQLYFAVGLPIIAVLTSLVINLFLMSGIRDDIREIRADLKLLTGKVYELMEHK